MKFEMMLKILMYLLSHGVVSANVLAERFEISSRSVYRYAEALNSAGYPVLCKRGPKGGLYVPDSFKLPASYLTKDELAAMIQAIDQSQTQTYSEAAARAKEKLLAFQRDLTSDYKIAGGYVIVDGAPWGDSYGFRKKLDIVRRAMDESRTLRIVYHDREGNVTDREIEPHYLLLKQGLAYLYAYCRKRKDFRFFKLGRIGYITMLYDTFSRRETPDFESSTEFKASAANIEVKMEVDAAARSEVEEWIGIDNVILRRDGRIEAIAILPNDEALVSTLMRFGTHVKVTSPAALAADLKKLAAEVADLYR